MYLLLQEQTPIYNLNKGIRQDSDASRKTQTTGTSTDQLY